MTSRGLTLAWAFFRQNKVKLFPVMGCWTKNQSWANCDFLGACIPSLKTQGQSVWSGEKAQIMKVFKQGWKSPWRNCSKRPEPFVFFCPIREQQALESFWVFLHANYMKCHVCPILFPEALLKMKRSLISEQNPRLTDSANWLDKHGD